MARTSGAPATWRSRGASGDTTWGRAGGRKRCRSAEKICLVCACCSFFLCVQDLNWRGGAALLVASSMKIVWESMFWVEATLLELFDTKGVGDVWRQFAFRRNMSQGRPWRLIGAKVCWYLCRFPRTCFWCLRDPRHVRICLQLVRGRAQRTPLCGCFDTQGFGNRTLPLWFGTPCLGRF